MQDYEELILARQEDDSGFDPCKDCPYERDCDFQCDSTNAPLHEIYPSLFNGLNDEEG